MQSSYNCKARLHTRRTRTGQCTPLPCTNTVAIHVVVHVRTRQEYVSAFRFSSGDPSVYDRDDAIAAERDSYINIMTVISLPPV